MTEKVRMTERVQDDRENKDFFLARSRLILYNSNEFFVFEMNRRE